LHSLKRDDEPSQVFYAGVSRSREIDHDSNLYATFRQEEARLRDEHPDLDIRRVILEQDLKREYQEFLQDHNRNRSDSDGRPGRDENEVREWAREHDLPYFDDQALFNYLARSESADERVGGRSASAEATADNLRVACQPQLTPTLTSVSEGW
jgi:hypothetical protein